MTRSAEFGRFSSVVMVSPYSRWAPVSTHARPTHRQRAGTNLGPSGILSIFLTSRRRHLELRTRTHAAAVANPAGGYRGAATTRNQTRSTMRSAAGAGRRRAAAVDLGGDDLAEAAGAGWRAVGLRHARAWSGFGWP